ncbi:MAG: 7-cyano-7-deazaguanine synthase QueC [Candidatus Omnitrophica bacterium]|nr:7-cyano-7-deazaguanine synthase QueC [Candidatus Omnitrophota bacterium]
MKRAIVLLSGGLDSAVTLYYAKNLGYKITCLSFDYSQRHQKEIKLAKRLAGLAGAAHIVLKVKFPARSSSLIDKKRRLPKRGLSKIKEAGIPSTYVPARNIIFLSYALCYAEVLSADSIFIGVNSVDYSGYPDCRPDFLKAFSRMSALGTRRGVTGRMVKIKTPLSRKSKGEIVKLGRRLKVPFKYTWSCYEGARYPCGACDSCRLRSRGFSEAGLDDPLSIKTDR